MKVFFAASFVALILSLPAASASAQQANNPPFDFPLHTTPEPPDRPNNYRRPWQSENRVLKRGPLAPTENDRKVFSTFLRDRHTGLIRLIPREARYNEAPKRLSIILSGGCYYSFAHRTHGYGYGSDIEFAEDSLRTGLAGADYGMMTNLGAVTLEEIEVTDPRIAFIASYKPVRKDNDARVEQSRFKAGVRADNLIYKNSLPLSLNSTYLLRSISYRFSDSSDVLVAFRVMRKDDDGSIIIVWKLLKKYRNPHLSRTIPSSNRQPRIPRWLTR
jgi:hypothetical protein